MMRAKVHAGVVAFAMTLAMCAIGYVQQAAAAVSHDGAAGLIVHTNDGVLRGLSSTNYNEWLGIPYAAPPVGALRFRAPQPAGPWSGVRDATHFGNRCVQGSGIDPGYESAKLTEDCLYLNVYVPHNSTGQRSGRRPVMVWIHGGGLTGGAGQDTDPRKYIEANGDVYVTINYRLGALGFLDLPQLEKKGAGNFGLLDQQAAIRWVQRNIARFGGDPRNVTIAGQSAGGSSVCDQLSSPTAHGLFQRAIIQSGGCAMTSQATAQADGQAYAKAVGCTDSTTVLACLRGKSPAELLAAQASAPTPAAVGGPSFPLNPAVAVPAGQFNRVPVINGQVQSERRLFVFLGNDFLGKPVTDASYEATVRATWPAAADQILAAYPVSSFSTPGIALATVQSDAASYGRLVLDRQFSQYVPTYAYEFDEGSTPEFYSIYRLQQQGEPAQSFQFGATHVDDLPYLWEYVGHTLPFSDDELELSDQMIAFWSSFQARGNPNGPYTPPWPAFNASNQQWMSLSACVTAESSNEPPAACSAASDSYVAFHKLALWASILG
jgi:para-nitrobenzyl esterase